MASRRGLIIAGIVTLLVGLITLFPARVAYRWLSPTELAISGIRGSVWSGSATHAGGNGVYFSNIQWRFQPLTLFTGKLAYDISANPAGGSVSANIAVSLGGALIISDLDAELALRTFALAANIPGLRGDAILQIERLVLSDGIPTEAQGKIEVSDLLLPLVAPTAIGGYEAEFYTQDGGIVASVKDNDGSVELAGSLSISAEGQYQFLGQVAAKANTPDRIREEMRFLGSPNARGQHELRLEGQL